MEYYLAELSRPPGQSIEGFDEEKGRIREAGRLSVLVLGSKGEQTVSDSIEPLEDQRLPDKVNSVVFDSLLALRSQNISVPDQFRISIDFTEPPAFFTYNPWDQPTPNRSIFEIRGPDRTWVTGVCDYVQGFFNQRRRHRKWIHSPITFNLLHWIVGIPASLWVVFRIDSAHGAKLESLHVALRGAIYIYIGLVMLLVFRMIVGGLRWVYPLVELKGAKAGRVRALLVAFSISLLAGLVVDVLRILL